MSTLERHEVSNNDVRNTGNTYKQASCASTSMNVDGHFDDLVDIDHGQMTGFNIPNYHQRLKRGELLPFTYWEQFKQTGQCRCNYITTKNGCTGNFQQTDTPRCYYPSYNWSVGIEEMRTRAESYDTAQYVQAAAAKMYGQGWDVLTFALELREAYEMIRAFGVDLINIIRRQGILRISTPGRYLEGRYGWRQLLFDMNDIIQFVNAIDDKRKRYKDRLGNSFTTYVARDPMIYDWAAFYHKVQSVVEMQISLRGAIVADFQPPKIHLNPVKSAWEIVTLSFVIDWFVGVGQWIDAMSFLVFSSNHAAAGGVSITGTVTTTLSDSYAKSGYGLTLCEVAGSSKFEYTLRTPMSVSLYPHLRLNLDEWKIADLIALLWQALKRR